jgi:DNA-binding NarL/FixJ family response regulator
VLLADDHAGLRQALGELLADDTDLVGQVSDGRQLVEAAGRLCPDIIVTDIAMPEMSGLEAMRRLQAAGSTARFIVLTVDRDPRVAAEALRAGASGYVFKQAAGEDLLDAVRAVMSGGTFQSRPAETGR